MLLRRRLFLLAAPLLPALLLAGCAVPEGAVGPPGGYDGGAPGGRLTLSSTDARVKTVQLYRTGDETSLPIVSLGSAETLTLAFDLLEGGTGAPLSVYFYHADRTWRRDLLPSEFLRAFLSDDIRDYQLASVIGPDYVHYTYEFPNPNIDFLVSGNYVVRVTEQGQEGAVLLERAFFVSEDAAEVDMSFQTGFSGGATVVQPVVQLRPGPALRDAQPFDYAVCFARNGRFDRGRCTQDPSLLDLALFQFFLDRRDAFPAERPYHEVDLGPLQANPQVASVDRSTEPYAVLLDLDYARFGSDVNRASLTGQPVVQTVYRGGGRAETQGEYVQVRFRYVPEGERRAAGPVLLSGAFNDWQLDPAFALTWDAAASRYEGTVLLKQGLYLYQYVVDDPSAEPPALLTQPSLYTALVYLHDPIRITDRLVAVRSAVAQ
jgi:hypothetical protein